VDQGRRPLVRNRGIRSLGLLVSLAGVFVVGVASVAYGSKPIPVGEVFAAVTDFDESSDHLVIRSLRIPRTLVGLGVGAGLDLAGAVMQEVT
jgi:iron complex transport system permease protein